MEKSMDFKQEAIKKIKKHKPSAKITHVSEVEKVSCEWCENKTNAVFISTACDNNGIHGQTVVFEDDSFCLQSDWWVCGRCEES